MLIQGLRREECASNSECEGKTWFFFVKISSNITASNKTSAREQENSDHQVLVIMAFRYCCGRAS